MPWERRRSSTSESLRSEPETRCPMARSTSAMALIPAPPMPTMWMCRGGPRSSAAPDAPASRTSAGMGVHQLGDAGGRVGMPVGAGGLAHGPEALRIGQEGIELEAQAPAVALVIGDEHRRPHADQRVGVAGLVF